MWPGEDGYGQGVAQESGAAQDHHQARDHRGELQGGSTEYIEVQNQVKYGGQMDFFPSRCFRKFLITQDKKKFGHTSWINISVL